MTTVVVTTTTERTFADQKPTLLLAFRRDQLPNSLLAMVAFLGRIADTKLQLPRFAVDRKVMNVTRDNRLARESL